jgi:four helix bundle protein
VRGYCKIIAWQPADRLVRLVYEAAAQLARDERFGLAQQPKRAAVPIPSNIAEGAGRFSDRESERFPSIASGSASEVRYQLELVSDLRPGIDGKRALGLAHEVKRLLWSLRHASRRGTDPSQNPSDCSTTETA